MGRKSVWPPRITIHKPTNRARCRWRGKDYYLGQAGSPESRAAYVELVRRLEREHQQGTGQNGDEGEPSSRPATVAELAALWYLECLERYGPANHEAREHQLAMQPVVELFGNMAVSEFRAVHLERVRDSMVRCGLCRNVINRRVVRIRTAWRWAERREIAPDGKWAALRALEPLSAARHDVRKTPRVQPARDSDVAAVLQIAPPALGDLVRLLLCTGARPGELFGLTVGMIDRSGPIWTAKLVHHKCAWRGHERTLYFGPQAQAVLLPLLEGRHPESLVLRNSKGAAWDRRNADMALRWWCRRAGVTKWSLYQLRHAFRVRVARVAGLEGARVLMGHATLDTTLLYGGGMDHETALDAARRAG